jgi:hypothetical protein
LRRRPHVAEPVKGVHFVAPACAARTFALAARYLIT